MRSAFVFALKYAFSKSNQYKQYHCNDDGSHRIKHEQPVYETGQHGDNSRPDTHPIEHFRAAV